MKQGAHTLPRKLEVVHSTTTTRSRIIPNVRRATPSGNVPGASDVTGAMVRSSVNAVICRATWKGVTVSIADVAIATFASGVAELKESVGLQASDTQKSDIFPEEMGRSVGTRKICRRRRSGVKCQALVEIRVPGRNEVASNIFLLQ